MNFLQNSAYADHEELHFFQDKDTGLQCLIAIHKLVKGVCGGGTRFYPYATMEAALTDVLRLSRAMTYKFALVGLPLGGGKGVIIGDPAKDKTEALLEAYGKRVHSLNGRYLTGSDVGTKAEDMLIVHRQTPHVAGVKGIGGDSSPLTGYGVFKAIEGAWQVVASKTSLEGVRVAIQGLGGVGFHLAMFLKEVGAKVVGADLHPKAVDRARENGVEIMEPEEILFAEVDVLAPCALGGIIHQDNIDKIKAKLICGGANNQLLDESLADDLHRKGIVFVPDFVASAGGVISGVLGRQGKGEAEMKRYAERILRNTQEILQASMKKDISPLQAAMEVAEERLGRR